MLRSHLPTRAEDSILVFRLASLAPKVMMPQIGRATVHPEGLAWVREWVGTLARLT